MSRRLIICSDGTWQSEDEPAPSNVCRLVDRIAPVGADGQEQRVFYQPGVGTDPTRGWLSRKLSSWLGGAFGVGLDRNILEIYNWLTHEYEDGDELWFFGFSRGAYTVRSTVGLIRNCGILKPAYARLAGRAMDLYRARARHSHPEAPRSRSFRRNYSHEIRNIQFVGVWDTVGALGIPGWLGLPAILLNRKYRFHDTDLSRIVRNAYHVLAIDERRRSFSPTLWTEDPEKPFRARVAQVWFPGKHSDVGGSTEERGLGDLTLCWMLEHATREGLGLGPADPPMNPDYLAEINKSRWWTEHVPIIRSIASEWRSITAEHRQAVHHDSVTRLRERDDYDPPNLREALRSGVPVTRSPVTAC